MSPPAGGDAAVEDSGGTDGAATEDVATDDLPTPPEDDGAAVEDPGPPPIDIGPDTGPATCTTAGCPSGQTCTLGADGLFGCYVSASIAESFDDATFKDPATTAVWAGGTLTIDSGSVGGSGKDGAFAPAADLTIDTAAGGAFEYTSFTIPKGVTVTVVGPSPLSIKVQGDVLIEGVLRSDGGEGQHACGKPDGTGKPPGAIALLGGQGGAGGGKGGDGGAVYGQDGQAGGGPGAGLGSTGSLDKGPVFAGGAGGASFGSKGADGTSFGANFGGAAGPVYGEAMLTTLQGGSGGGGGAGKDHGGNDGTCPGCGPTKNCYQAMCTNEETWAGDGFPNAWDTPGGSGGGGGGALGITAGGTIVVRGRMSADGGNGGWGDFSGAGGGGSGGAIRLSAWGEVLLDGGTLSAVGGKGGFITCSNQVGDAHAGDGGDGRIRIESVTGLSQGYLTNPSPPPSFAEPAVALEGGTGKDGAFKPDPAQEPDVELDTDLGPYEFTSFELPKGVTLHAKGSAPLTIRSQTTIDGFGVIDLSGETGGNGYSACCGNPYGTAHAGAGGVAGAGGHSGGAGGSAGPGEAGEGPGGAPGGPAGSFSSAGGAGYAKAGQNGGTNECSGKGPLGGAAYGDEAVGDLEGGSGGGGAGDASAAACSFCQAGQCMAVGQIGGVCPAAPTCDSYCVTVNPSCTALGPGCVATDRWNPGSGGGGGGGALHFESTGLVRIDGIIRLNGGNGGDNLGASEVNDGTCGPGCDKGCYQGTCGPTGGGSFGGSGGGGSGGAFRVRAQALRAEGLLEARGGGTGTLSQGGGCGLDPSAADPLPGQGRGGRGSPGRIRIETSSPTGSVVIGEGSFSHGKTEPKYGTLGQSTWYPMKTKKSHVSGIVAQGLGPADVLEVSVAPAGPEGQPNDGIASPWTDQPATLPAGAFVRFRVQLALPKPGKSASTIDEVIIDTLSPAEP